MHNIVLDIICYTCNCDEGYYYSYIAEECICEFLYTAVYIFIRNVFIIYYYIWYIFFPSIAIEGVYQYEPTVLRGCDPERNAEYRINIEAETEALISEYFSISNEESN